MNNRKQTTRTWRVWLTALIAGILLPLFGARATAQAAAWRTLGQPAHASALAHGIQGDDDKGDSGGHGGSDDSGNDDSGDSSSDDSGNDNSDDNGSDDNGGASGNDSPDDNGSDDNGGASGSDSPDDNGSDDNGGASGSDSPDDNGSDDKGGVSGNDSSDDNGADDKGGPDNSVTENRNEVLGSVGQIPAGTLVGKWMVGGKSFTVTAKTEINLGNSSVAQGACVKLHLNADGQTVRELEVENRTDCTAGSNATSQSLATRMW